MPLNNIYADLERIGAAILSHHVDDFDLRHRTRGDAIGQFEQSVLARLAFKRRRMEAAFQTGSSGAEYDAGIGGAGAALRFVRRGDRSNVRKMLA